ncbi:MAG: uroporphyrinogen-III synthase [Acidimicrobiales bacterium]
MEPLAGWSIAVTAERRATEQGQMLEARGARVLYTPMVASSPCEEGALRARTNELLADPPDVVVANTAIGVRSWIALASSWGLGAALHSLLGGATLVARGTKAAGALMSEGLDVGWLSREETLADVVEHLVARGVAGQRVALQHDGRLETPAVERLRGAGATVVELPIYRTTSTPAGRGSKRLANALGTHDVDAITFTSPAAVCAYAGLLDGLGSRGDPPDVVGACIGPVTAAAASAAGLHSVVVPARARLGPMVKMLADEMAARGVAIDVAGVPARLQGARLAIGTVDSQLTPRERTLLGALIDADGAVVSKSALARLAWTDDVEEHTVEVTVNRLRLKLGAAAAALQTTNRRGYRLVTGTPQPSAHNAAPGL